jgi:hypothetical protein
MATTTPRRPGRIGRPSKGARKARTIRFPRPMDAALEKHARAAGYDNVNDYVVDIVFRAKQVPGIWPASAPGQEHLPMKLPKSA